MARRFSASFAYALLLEPLQVARITIDGGPGRFPNQLIHQGLAALNGLHS